MREAGNQAQIRRVFGEQPEAYVNMRVDLPVGPIPYVIHFCLRAEQAQRDLAPDGKRLGIIQVHLVVEREIEIVGGRVGDALATGSGAGKYVALFGLGDASGGGDGCKLRQPRIHKRSVGIVGAVLLRGRGKGGGLRRTVEADFQKRKHLAISRESQGVGGTVEIIGGEIRRRIPQRRDAQGVEAAVGVAEIQAGLAVHVPADVNPGIVHEPAKLRDVAERAVGGRVRLQREAVMKTDFEMPCVNDKGEFGIRSDVDVRDLLVQLGMKDVVFVTEIRREAQVLRVGLTQRRELQLGGGGDPEMRIDRQFRLDGGGCSVGKVDVVRVFRVDSGTQGDIDRPGFDVVIRFSALPIHRVRQASHAEDAGDHSASG